MCGDKNMCRTVLQLDLRRIKRSCTVFFPRGIPSMDCTDAAGLCAGLCTYSNTKREYAILIITPLKVYAVRYQCVCTHTGTVRHPSNFFWLVASRYGAGTI